MGTIGTDGTLDTSAEYISGGVGYNSTGNYVTSETDSCGNVTTYNVNNANGMVNSVTSPATVNGVDKSVQTDYNYYEVSRLLESVSLGDSTVSYTYDSKRRLDTITTANGTVYSFTYDNFGNRTSVKVDGNSLVTYSYVDENNNDNSRKGLISTVTYGNNATVGYTYDNFDRVIEKKENDTTVLKIFYNNKGQTARQTDLKTGQTTEYLYDLGGRLIQSYDQNGARKTVKYTYDVLDRVISCKETLNGVTNTTEYTYGSDSRVASVNYGSLSSVNTYDHLNRLTAKVTTLSEGKTARVEYTYINGTVLVETQKTFINGILYETLLYSYDKAGNISSITKDGALLESYTYDELNQLKTVTRGTDVTEYFYDNAGNIQTVKKNGTVVDSYTYGDTNWEDKLTAFNGNSFTYDAIGNPLNYRDGMTFSWSNGRKLTGITKNSDSIVYAYNSDGNRISKTVNGVITTYILNSSGDVIAEQKGTDYIRYFVDESGTKIGFNYNGASYYYVKNIQGDITGITDTNGNVLAKYTYDEWGKLLSVTNGNGVSVISNATHIGNINPLRYRGYYYDIETGLYYLQSRYYDPTTRRFINADGYVSTGQGILGNNMFAYCGNNPINFSDPTGCMQIWERLGFQYDGSVCDFRRLEQGLSPRSYEKWLSNGGTLNVNRTDYKDNGVTKKMKTVTYIPEIETKKLLY